MLRHEALILKILQLCTVNKGAALVHTSRGKNSSGEFCLVSEELVQVSSKGCVCSFFVADAVLKH